MLPVFSIHDTADRARSNPELGCDLALKPQAAGIQRPDLDDLGLLQLGVDMFFSARHSLWMFSHTVLITEVRSPLGRAIAHVVFLRTAPQMPRVHAGGLVTGVTDEQRGRVITIGKPEGRPVSENPLPFPDPEHPVSGTAPVALPEPAIVRPAFRQLFPMAIDVVRGQFCQRFKIRFSHLVSFTDHLVRAARC